MYNLCRDFITYSTVRTAIMAILNTCRFSNSDELINDLRETHNELIEIDNKEEFLSWRADFEKSTTSSFVLHSKETPWLSVLLLLLYCNCSGVFNWRAKGKRSLKLQGSSKIGSHYVAYIRAQKHLSGKLDANICSHHFHETQLAHLLLPESSRQINTAKVHDDVSINAILNSVRDNVHGDNVNLAELVSCQDIHNIRHEYNIEGVQYHVPLITVVFTCGWKTWKVSILTCSLLFFSISSKALSKLIT